MKAFIFALLLTLATAMPVLAQPASPSLADEVALLSEAVIDLQKKNQAQAVELKSVRGWQETASQRYATQRALGALGAKVADAQRAAAEAKGDAAIAINAANAVAVYAQGGRPPVPATVRQYVPPPQAEATRLAREARVAEAARILRESAASISKAANLLESQ